MPSSLEVWKAGGCHPVAVTGERLTVGSVPTNEAAVKRHLVRLYEKFAIHEEGERRRVRPANAAVRRGAIALPELGRG